MDKQKIIKYTPARPDQAFGDIIQQSRTLKLGQMRELVHELYSYKTALETQNEKLLHMQRQLSSSEKKYLTLFNASPFPYLVLSKNGVILETNRAFTKLIGIDRSDPVHKPFLEFTAPDSHDLFHEHFRKVLKTRGRQSCRLSLLRASKAPLHVLLQSVYMQNSSKRSVQICTAIFDITEQMETEKNLTRYCDSLEEMLKKCSLELQKARKQFKDLADSGIQAAQ